MRQVEFKLSRDSILSASSYNIGYIGEHNATEIIIEIPADCISEADCFLLNFNDGHADFVSNVITSETADDGAWVDGNKIHCILWQQITRGSYLSITLEGYQYNGSKLVMLFKLPRINGLKLSPANEGCIKPVDSLRGIQAQITNILNVLSDRQSLMDALGNFSINDDGEIQFNGETLITSKDYFLMSKTFILNGDDLYIDTSTGYANVDENGNILVDADSVIHIEDDMVGVVI